MDRDLGKEILMDWLTLKYIRNTTVENMCCTYPNFLHSIKIKHFIILHVLRFEGIIFAIKVVYDLEVLVQIDTACARVYKFDLSSSYLVKLKENVKIPHF